MDFFIESGKDKAVEGRNGLRFFFYSVPKPYSGPLLLTVPTATGLWKTFNISFTIEKSSNQVFKVSSHI